MEIEKTKKIARMIAGYERGIYTLLEAGSQVLECITALNVADVYSTLPVDFQRYLISIVESSPTSDSEWESAEYIHIGSANYVPGREPPERSPDEECAAMCAWKRNHRHRIEALRQLLNESK